jgi:hypothetical protein
MDTLRKVSFNLNTAKNGYVITIYENDENNGGMFNGESSQFIASSPMEAIELLQKALS